MSFGLMPVKREGWPMHVMDDQGRRVACDFYGEPVRPKQFVETDANGQPFVRAATPEDDKPSRQPDGKEKT
jgi:hypothetical protein